MKKTLSILFVLALVLSALVAGSGLAGAQGWSGADTIRDETFYVASSSLTLGAWGTGWQGVQGYVIADVFQINMEYQAGILDSDIANINTYLFPANTAFPPGHTDGTWEKNFGDPEYYYLDVDPDGGLTVYEYDGLVETVEADIQWTLTGWHQTILAGDIIDHGDSTITLRVLPYGTYRPFVNDPPVNNVEVFSGQLQTEVLGYRFTGSAAGVGPDSVLEPILRGSEDTATATGTGTASFDASEGAIEDLTAVDEADLPLAGKPRLAFPHGFFALNVVGVTPGATVTVSITLPQPVPTGTEYWKYYLDAWHQIPMTIDPNDSRIIHITLVDGGLGDADATANGIIIDQGGPGTPRQAVGWEGSSVNKVAVVAPWIALLAAIAGASLLVLRQRRAQI